MAEEERTVKKLLDLARTAINEHDLQTAQTRLDEAAGIAPKSEAVASLREELKARETAVVEQRLVKETRHRQAEETANKLVALGRKALQANDIKMAEAHFDQAFVIRPESEHVVKLREDLETYKLRAQEDHKRRVAEEERTVKKLLDLARTAINEHDLQTAQTRLDEAAGIAPTSEAVASLREELKARETAVVEQRLVKETRHRQAEETANKLVALGRKALQANDIKMAEAHFDQAFVIRPESEHVAKLREDLETHKLRAQEDHKRRVAEEERTVKKLLDLARTAINEHDLQTAQTRLDEAAGIAPTSEAVASLREELKARETAVVEQRLVEETRHRQAEETANKLVALGRKALQANDIKMAEAHFDQAFVIRPESEHVVKLREDLETHKLRAQEDHKRRVAEEERTVEKLLDLARTAINEHDLQTAQTRLDKAAGMAPTSEAVASLREELKARETAVVEQRLVEETRHRQAEETANKLVALGRKALQANDIKMAEAHFDQAFVIWPESEHVVKLREDLETHKLRAQEDHKRRVAEEERTVEKLLDLARTAINEHDLQTAQTRLDKAAGMAPTSEAVASLREELKARETAVVEQRLVKETRHRQAEETANKVVAPDRGRTGNEARPAVVGRLDGKIESIPALNRSLQPANVPVNTPITNDRVRSAVDPSNETAGGSPPERGMQRRHRGKWLGYSAAIAGIVGLGLSLAWMRPGSFAILYDAADEWLSGNLFSEEGTETISEPVTQVPVPEQLAPESRAQGREDPAGEPTLSQPSLDRHIGTLLEAAKADLDAGRLTHPPGRNAIEKYWAVLVLRPDVEEARRAIQDIATRLTSATREALDRKQWDEARTRLDEAAVIAPESETVASLRNELKARETRQVSIREVTPSRVRVRPGETVRFYTEYSLTLPASDKEALVKASMGVAEKRPENRARRYRQSIRKGRPQYRGNRADITPPDRIRAIHRRASGASG